MTKMLSFYSTTHIELTYIRSILPQTIEITVFFLKYVSTKTIASNVNVIQLAANSIYLRYCFQFSIKHIHIHVI